MTKGGGNNASNRRIQMESSIAHQLWSYKVKKKNQKLLNMQYYSYDCLANIDLFLRKRGYKVVVRNRSMRLSRGEVMKVVINAMKTIMVNTSWRSMPKS